MKSIDKIKNACAGKWRMIDNIARETKLTKAKVALIILENPMEFVINYNTPTGASTLVKRSY